MRHLTSFTHLFILASALALSSNALAEPIEENDSTLLPEGRQKKSLLKFVTDAFTGMDSAYCVKSSTTYGVELMDRLSQEYVDFTSPDGHRFKTSSRLSNRLGPYFGYKGIYVGATFDLFMDKTKKRSELTVFLNTQPLSIELIRRRTGGDFRLDKYLFNNGEYVNDMTSLVADKNIGDCITNKQTGVNINYFLNHRKYSNPAGFTRGVIQKRSAGSVILGGGFTRQEMNFVFFDDNDVQELVEFAKDLEFPGPNYGTQFLNHLITNLEEDATAQVLVPTMLTRSPALMTIDDAHIQVGYAYNWVITPKLLLAVQATMAPGYKWLKYKTDGTVAYSVVKKDGDMHGLDETLIPLLDKYGVDYDPENVINNYSPSVNRIHAFDINYIGRAALTYRHKRWRFGSCAQFNSYNFKHNGYSLRNHYWDARFYVGYGF